MDYETLRRRTRALQDEGKLPTRVTDEQKADWAYGNAVIDNPDVTLEMAQRAVAKPRRRKPTPLSEARLTEALSEVDHYRQLAHDAVATGDLATASGWLEALRDEVQAALNDPAELVAQVDYYRHAVDMAVGQRDAVEADLRALQAKYDALVKP